jgi:excisionase family DNA binding protein
MKKTTTKPSFRETSPGKKPYASSEMKTVLQVAEYLVVNPETIYRLLKNRCIPGFRVGYGWRFRRSDIDQWISDRQMKPEGPGGPGLALAHLHRPGIPKHPNPSVHARA